ncbi:hypothetical protein [Pseudomonas frederiksbergensis]|uniref:hypothetical protein n=1 Tax=Pseudomonas frederiksbergensis TaxID=104087 RepID=UPI0021820818|nr:hypothetical protein [Pseudomonas frederiksbergensis]
MNNRYTASLMFLLALVTAQLAYSSGKDESAESASLLCKILDGNDALTQASEFSAKNRAVYISVDGSAEDAKKLCPVISSIVADNAMTFTEGWTVQVSTPGDDYKVAAVCPL